MIHLDKKIYTSSVLGLFFDDPQGRFHIREIARRAGLHPNTVLRDVKLLAKEGLLCVKRTKAVVEVTANRDNALFTRLKRLENVRRVMLSGLVEVLDYAYGAPEAIVLFGSYGRGEDTLKSDIDVAVVTSRKARPDLSKFEALLKRSIQIVELDLKTVGKNLLSNVANGFVLKGYLTI
ncbi:nucleotidyltransferase domain-containing protein [Candidatus Woesearchaeota archaeon]|nr:nucleotidyltransferase domain-containing protein [Candidatus Woesearchaeota archaeon]